LKRGLPEFLDIELGQGGVFAKYTHSDVVLSLFVKSLTQGTCLSDLEIGEAKLAGQQFSPLPSPDTLDYVCQRLKQSNQVKTTIEGMVHELNYDNRGNALLVKLALKCNQLKPSDKRGYTLD